MILREHRADGFEYLELVTALLHRARTNDATAGLWEAADLQWWWRRDQHPDPALQIFWFDDDAPVAAVIFTNWGGRWGCDVISATGDPSTVSEVVWPRALEQIDRLGSGSVEVVAEDDDVTLLEALADAGFEPTGEVGVATWMPAACRPQVSPLADGFVLLARDQTWETQPATPPRAHHMIGRNGDHVAARLAECPLYRADLDLAVYAQNGDVAGYGLFWADPVTGVGLVEPMRTEDAYQGLGLARHVLTSGLDRLAAHGCSTLKVSYIEGNEAARRLYLSAGFSPGSTSRTYRLDRQMPG
ncbi:MAG TPA: GNAT family N-acetyltransferase [Ilumatobacteraceae bacterium]|nr:GNAT family N-acetyltransferase [Ilumatobacteraceae bacterium]